MFKHFEDAAADEIKTLYKQEAFERSRLVSDVEYKLAYALIPGGTTFEGNVVINFNLNEDGAKSDSVFLDYKG